MMNVMQASPGEQVVYHVGDLAIDRVDDPRLNKLASQMLELYQQNEVELVQEKLDFGTYRYIAVRKQKIGLVQRYFVGCYAEQ